MSDWTDNGDGTWTCNRCVGVSVTTEHKDSHEQWHPRESE